MINLDLAQLEYFKAVATHGSITLAAEMLHISQPALSRSIAKLEQEVGAPLFDRENHRVILNSYGRLFLASVDLAFTQLNTGIKSVRRLYHSDQHILTIASCNGDFLVSLLRSFVVANPDIAFRQFRYTKPEIEMHLIEHDIDLALCATPIESSYIHYEVMSESEFVLAHSRSLEIPDVNPISLSQLKDVYFICDSSRVDSEYLKEICSGIKFEPNITYEVENVELLYELLCSKAGVAIVPLPYFWKMRKDFGDKELLMRHIDEKLPKAEVGVAWLKDRPLSDSSVKIIKHLRKFLEVNTEIFKQYEEAAAISSPGKNSGA